MKLRWKITMGVVAVGAIGAFLFFWSGSSAHKAVEEARRALRNQGLKTDLSEFNFFTSAEFQAREAALTNAGLFSRPTNQEEARRRSLRQQLLPNMMQPIAADAAIPVWQQTKLPTDENTTHYVRAAGLPGDDLWPVLQDVFDDDRELLDAACAATLAGPIRFNLNASHGSAMLLPQLAVMKNLAQTFGCRAVLELHNGNNDAAWTNLLAATRLVTAHEPEATEISHLVRIAGAAVAFNSTWQLLKAKGWSDEQLSRLQREWESVDFFKALPETAAFARACAADACQKERQQPLGPSGLTVKDFLRAPRQSLSGLKYYYGRIRYRHHGSFEDESALLLYYRDRELDLRNAIQAATWSAMRQFPGVTNNVPFQSKHSSSSAIAMLNSRQLMLSFQRQGQGLLGRASEAETRRRLIVTAIALERYRSRHGFYPKMPEELVPGYVKELPTDFMDGQPLRYRLTDDGHFVLYSVGLDCVDDGGKLRRPTLRGMRNEGPLDFGVPQGIDLVWPRPASKSEAQAHVEETIRQKEETLQAALQREAGEEQRSEALRQAAVKRLLTEKPTRSIKEPNYEGKPLSQILRNESTSGTATVTLYELLTLRQIAGGEAEIAIFEVPIRYDVLTNIGMLDLIVDAEPEEDSESRGGELQACARATNGNCLLIWNTIYDPPGQHVVHARLLCSERKNRNTFEVRGPVMPFYSSNLCQFDRFYSAFDSSGATLYAKLPESNGTYTIELKSPAGTLIKTLKGTTSNGVIKVEWDLKDEHGQPYTSDSFQSVFHITLPDSGRSQTRKGQ